MLERHDVGLDLAYVLDSRLKMVIPFLDYSISLKKHHSNFPRQRGSSSSI